MDTGSLCVSGYVYMGVFSTMQRYKKILTLLAITNEALIRELRRDLILIYLYTLVQFITMIVFPLLFIFLISSSAAGVSSRLISFSTGTSSMPLSIASASVVKET